MKLEIDWWLSLLLAIPIGILTNLVTPKIQSAFERRSAEGRKRQEDERAKHAARVKQYVDDLPAFYIFLLSVGIKISLLSALESLINSATYLIPNVMQLVLGEMNSSRLFSMVAIADSLMRLMTTLAIFNVCKDAILMIAAVKEMKKKGA